MQTLGDIVTIKTGKLDANACSADGEYPFFTCSNEPLRISSFSYDCKCVLVAGNGDLNVKYYNGKFDAYQRTYIIESRDESTLATRYLYWFLSKYVEKLRELSIGGVIKYIKINNLTDPKISLPPLPEQQRIAAILDKADSLRKKRKQAIAKLDELLKSVFLDMFGDPVTNPKGWDEKLLSYFINQTRDVSYGIVQRGDYIDNGVPVIRIRDIIEGTFRECDLVKTTSEISDKYKRTILEGGELLISIRGTVGKIALAPANTKGWNISREVAIIPIHGNININFLIGLLESAQVQTIFQSMIKGVAQSGMNLSDLRKLKTISPSVVFQDKFSETYEKTEDLKLKMKREYEKEDELFNSLMQRYFG